MSFLNSSFWRNFISYQRWYKQAETRNKRLVFFLIKMMIYLLNLQRMRQRNCLMSWKSLIILYWLLNTTLHLMCLENIAFFAMQIVTQSYSARCMFSHDPSPPDAHLCTLCLPMALLKHCFNFALILQLVSSFYIRVYFRTISNLLYALHCSYSDITLYDITLNTSCCGVISRSPAYLLLLLPDKQTISLV